MTETSYVERQAWEPFKIEAGQFWHDRAEFYFSATEGWRLADTDPDYRDEADGENEIGLCELEILEVVESEHSGPICIFVRRFVDPRGGILRSHKRIRTVKGVKGYISGRRFRLVNVLPS